VGVRQPPTFDQLKVRHGYSDAVFSSQVSDAFDKAVTQFGFLGNARCPFVH
jgi:hypothetical protein